MARIPISYLMSFIFQILSNKILFIHKRFLKFQKNILKVFRNIPILKFTIVMLILESILHSTKFRLNSQGIHFAEFSERTFIKFNRTNSQGAYHMLLSFQERAYKIWLNKLFLRSPRIQQNESLSQSTQVKNNITSML